MKENLALPIKVGNLIQGCVFVVSWEKGDDTVWIVDNILVGALPYRHIVARKFFSENGPFKSLFLQCDRTVLLIGLCPSPKEFEEMNTGTELGQELLKKYALANTRPSKRKRLILGES